MVFYFLFDLFLYDSLVLCVVMLVQAHTHTCSKQVERLPNHFSPCMLAPVWGGGMVSPNSDWLGHGM